ncbi:AarF/UbiB family protein [Nocardiopsis sp. NPDC006938]|uniref:AarF/UbiB family protein n=1 Tax=Nocardiopsis sp. NPDC006938 TaxID=3364337 RepID=UPI0036CCE071
MEPLSPRVGRAVLARRLCAVALVGAGTAAAALAGAGIGLVLGGRPGARRGLARAVTGGLQALGPTAAKAGQLVGARRDMIGPEWADALSVLHDRSRPMSRRSRERALARARAEVPALAEVEVTDVLLGSGTVGCVYLGRHGADEVAVKLRRPGVDRVMAADLRLLRGAAALAVRLDGTGGRPLADLVDHVSAAILAQTDYTAEADHHRTLEGHLAGMPGVLIPGLRPRLCGPSVLVTDYVPGLGEAPPGGFSATAQAVAARRALRAVRRMVFEDGFVHCDLHPGNLYVHGNGAVVLLDAGYAVRVREATRAHLDRFFRAVALGDGRTCGEIMVETALEPVDDARREAFVSDMAAHVAAHSGDGTVFTMAEFGNGVFELQTRHGVHSRAEFVFPLSALLVVEGTLRDLMPTVEIQNGF